LSTTQLTVEALEVFVIVAPKKKTLQLAKDLRPHIKKVPPKQKMDILVLNHHDLLKNPLRGWPWGGTPVTLWKDFGKPRLSSQESLHSDGAAAGAR